MRGEMQIAGSKELLEQVLNQDLCSVCGACVGLCPYFKVFKGKVARIFDCDLEQGRCFAYCPKTETDFEQLAQHYFRQSYRKEPLGNYRQIKVSKAGQKLSSGRFQNGGTVSALVTFALENGFIKAIVSEEKPSINKH